MSIGTLNEYKELVDEHLLHYLPEIDNKTSTIYDSMKYSLEAGGKRLRPALLMAACEFSGGDRMAALPYACAMEFIHTYSLIHDDLPCMDDDELRRGKPTNHVVYGAGIATLAGDGLLNSAFEAMYKDMFMYFDDFDELKARVRAGNEIAKGAGCTGMVAGQVADLEAVGKTISGEMLDFIHISKTAAMIRAALRAGGMIGHADETKLRALTDYGEALGLAFQIQDDILDVVGTAEELGKNPGVDEEMDKATYPAIYGLEASYKRNDELCDQAIAIMEPFGEEADFFVELIQKVRSRRK